MRRPWQAAAVLASMLGCSRGSAPAPAASASPPPTSAAPAASPVPGSPADANRPLPQPLPEVAGLVNGHPIPSSLLSSIVEPALQIGRVTRDRRPEAYRQALDQIVLRELMLQEAAARKIVPDEAAVERVYNETRSRFKTEEQWDRFLSGGRFDAKSFREELRNRQRVEGVVRQEAEKLTAAVTDAEAKAFYDQNPKLFDPGERLRASHILIRVPEGAAPDVKQSRRAQAEALLARIRKGGDFAAVAREASEDPGSAARGGELGVFGRGQMVPVFEQAAFALPVGQVSDVVESPFGFHIIKVHERVPAGKVPFETVREQIKNHVAQSRREKALNGLVQGLKAKAKIETYL